MEGILLLYGLSSDTGALGYGVGALERGLPVTPTPFKSAFSSSGTTLEAGWASG